MPFENNNKRNISDCIKYLMRLFFFFTKRGYSRFLFSFVQLANESLLNLNIKKKLFKIKNKFKYNVNFTFRWIFWWYLMGGCFFFFSLAEEAIWFLMGPHHHHTILCNSDGLNDLEDCWAAHNEEEERQKPWTNRILIFLGFLLIGREYFIIGNLLFNIFK